MSTDDTPTGNDAASAKAGGNDGGATSAGETSPTTRRYDAAGHTGSTEAIHEATKARRLLSERRRKITPHALLDSAEGEPLLVLEDVEVSYGAVRALRGVSVAVHDGEIVTIIGSNGAGKSTTLKTISGLLHPSAGAIRLAGESIAGMAPDEIVKRGIVHVPEGRRIFSHLSVDENLSMGAYLRKDRAEIEKDRDRVLRIFPRLGERLGQRGGTLSGGEQQMLAIARGIMARPRVLMLDEPSLGLAPVLVQQIFTEIVNLNREHKLTILLVEQNAAMALRVAARAYVLETGGVALEGPAKELAADEAVRSAYLGSVK